MTATVDGDDAQDGLRSAPAEPLVVLEEVALEDSALGLIIAYEELARAGRQIYVFYNNPLAVGLLIAAIYVIINYGLSRLAIALEARQRRVAPVDAGA